MDKLRKIVPLVFPDVVPKAPTCEQPELIQVSPLELWVDESYQRNLSNASRCLIRKIISGWDWRGFKPPVCVRVGDRLHVIDGQHTAIAAASHGSFETIPVLIVAADRPADRASAFVKHNRDRIATTPTQLYYALIAAGDEVACDINAACDRSGVTVRKQAPGNGVFGLNETLAVTTLRAILFRRHPIGLRRVLDVCVEAKLQPISSIVLRAVENLLFADEFEGDYDPGDIATVLRGHLHDLTSEARAFHAQHRVPIWRGLAVAIGKRLRKRRGRSRAA